MVQDLAKQALDISHSYEILADLAAREGKWTEETVKQAREVFAMVKKYWHAQQMVKYE